MDNIKFDELLKKAEEVSRNEFLYFTEAFYGIDKCVFSHLWDVPIIEPYKVDTIIAGILPNRTEEELYDILYDFAKEEVRETKWCITSFDKLKNEFSIDEIEIWKKQVETGEVVNVPNAIIIYDELKLKNHYEDLVKKNSEKENSNLQEEIEKTFLDYIKEFITFERCCLNANYTNLENLTNNSSLVFFLSEMINNYQKGDSLEDCLYKVIKDKSEMIENDLGIKELLTIYIIFLEELTEWLLFGAYDFEKVNKLQKRTIDIYGENSQLSHDGLKQKVEEYMKVLEKEELSVKKKVMLNKLGYNVNEPIQEENIFSTSNNMINEKNNKSYVNANLLEVVGEKSNLIEKILNKIKIFFKKNKKY